MRGAHDAIVRVPRAFRVVHGAVMDVHGAFRVVHGAAVDVAEGVRRGRDGSRDGRHAAVRGRGGIPGTPTVFQLLAQGCPRQRATLGELPVSASTLKGLYRACSNPFRVVDNMYHAPRVVAPLQPWAE